MSAPLCISYIRFSSASQAEGTSLERQLQLSRKYAADHGLHLDESLSYQDLGKSAYSADHIKSGRLGDLLELIKLGKIARGTVLLVESLDRLSREAVMDAFGQFQSIINEGIKIVTLCDDKEYTKESLNNNFSDLMFSLSIMVRANDESERKSQRISAAYELKRKNLSTVKQTANCPGWLKLSPNREHFDLLPARVEIVKEIYSLSFGGVGIKTITRILNEKAIPAFRSSKGWCQSSVRKILSHRAVIGEFQPRKYNRTTRGYDLAGDPVPEYFPRILEDDVFYAIQGILANGTHRAGRTAKVENLFGGITKCGYCGARMDVVTKGKFPDDVRHLTCDSARRGFGNCNHVALKCNELEIAFITYCREKDFLELLNQESTQDKTRCLTLSQQISSREGELITLEAQISRIDEDLLDSTDKLERNHLRAQRTSMLHRKVEIQSAIASHRKEVDSVNATTNDSGQKVTDILTLFALANTTLEEADRIHFRTKLRNHLRQIVAKVVVYPRGLIYSDDDIAKAVQQNGIDIDDDEIQSMIQTQSNTKDDRYFVIYFKNGNYRHIKYIPKFKTYQVAADRIGDKLEWSMGGKQMKTIDGGDEERLITAEIQRYQRQNPELVLSEDDIELLKKHLEAVDYDESPVDAAVESVGKSRVSIRLTSSPLPSGGSTT